MDSRCVENRNSFNNEKQPKFNTLILQKRESGLIE
jgi:hypothetical protein